MKNTKEIENLRQKILPFGGIIGLVATAIYRIFLESPFATYEELKDAILELENILPIRDQLQILFTEDVEDVEMYYYLTIQKFVQEQILDKQNPDKFSDWWDLAQEGE